MGHLLQPCMVRTHAGEMRRATVIDVDLITRKCFVSIPDDRVVDSRCTGWFEVERVELID